jgi:YggT family protein
MALFIQFIDYVLYLYTLVVVVYVVVSWLVQLRIINPYNDFVRNLIYALSVLVDPVLSRIRRYLPNTGGLDFSPVVLLLGILFIRWVVLGNVAQVIQLPASRQL